VRESAKKSHLAPARRLCGSVCSCELQHLQSELVLGVLGVGITGGTVLRATDVAAKAQEKVMSRPQESPSQEILVPISVGELMDKIAILEIKSERIKNPNQVKNIVQELEALRAVLLGAIDRAILDKLSAELKRVNEKLWDVENAMRDCDARGDFSDSFIELARTVYRLNNKRSRLKKAINLASGSRFFEEKSYRRARWR
jgi:Family of unknown function (DUF6165)